MKKTTTKRNTVPEYILTMTIDKDVMTASGSSADEALSQIKPKKISSKALVSLSFDGKTSSTYLMVAKTKRILMNPLARFLFGKRMTLMLK